MKVLLTGSNGFVGRHVKASLERAGHQLLCGASPRRHGTDANTVPMDFSHDTQAAIWLPRLQGVDAVVNTVGVLRTSAARPIEAVHYLTPQALFDACAQAGVRQVIQVSALGVTQSSTRYASTKLAADEHLMALVKQGSLSATVLRPSVVFGKGGDSSALFMNLARLPVGLFPGPMLTARVQPVAVNDLADVVAALLQSHQALPALLECTGPEPLTMGALIASLRAQCGKSPALMLRLPGVLTKLSARLGDLGPASVPWCSETLAMLGVDNVADNRPFEQWLGRASVHYRDLLAQAWR
jgi:uncharacterized protein YbjT (DUF2867 family)